MDKYVAYVSTYTMGDKHGIKIFDVNTKTGRFTEQGEVEITHSSYITISHNQKHQYSITELGVERYHLLQNVGWEFINA